MATATSRKRFIKCVQCETTLILPGASESNGTRCPVCGYGFTAADRDRVWRSMAARGIECGRYFPPLHRLPLCAPFSDPSSDLRVTEEVAGQTLALPLFNHLTSGEIAEVCGALAEAVRIT